MKEGLASALLRNATKAGGALAYLFTELNFSLATDLLPQQQALIFSQSRRPRVARQCRELDCQMMLGLSKPKQEASLLRSLYAQTWQLNCPEFILFADLLNFILQQLVVKFLPLTPTDDY